jgi:hypothetical protein
MQSTTEQQAMAVETRRQKRRAFDFNAAIDLQDGSVPQPCSIADISDGGARILITGDEQLIPDRWVLWLAPNGKVRRPCRTAWRSAGQIGVQFISTR